MTPGDLGFAVGESPIDTWIVESTRTIVFSGSPLLSAYSTRGVGHARTSAKV